jgi:bacillaene synthase trans-acting acyltransferase
MSNRSIVFMFSGQGSHYYQMGRAFFDGNTAFRRILLEMDDTARPLLGRSIVDVLYTDGRRKDEPFDDIRLTSAAIFMVEYALARILMDDGVRPDYLLASSMGTYAAAAIAAALDPAEALKSVIGMATLYGARCRKGGMIAILGPARLHRELTVLRENSDVAAVNFASHFVISTIAERFDEIEAVLVREKIAFQRIAVSWPFHSRWIEHVQEAILEILGRLRFQSPAIPLVCCARSGILEALTPESLWNSVRKPIEFEQTVVALERRGPCCYIDVGPAGTLATMLKHMLPSASASRACQIMSPFGAELRNYRTLTSDRSLSGGLSADPKYRNMHA